MNSRKPAIRTNGQGTVNRQLAPLLFAVTPVNAGDILLKPKSQ
jgi:hypothetical protein